MSEERKIIVYHYKREKDLFTTPNVEIAISRRIGKTDIHVETVINGESEWSTLVVS